MTAQTTIAPTAETSLAPVVGALADRNPALAYLAGLAPGSSHDATGA